MHLQLVAAVLVLVLSGCGSGMARGPRAVEPTSSPAVREGWATASDGVRLFYRVHGTRGDTLVYVHGGPGGNAGRQMANLLPLASRHVIVAYDQRAGNGRSDLGDTLALDMPRHVADLEAVRRAGGGEVPCTAGCARLDLLRRHGQHGACCPTSYCRGPEGGHTLAHVEGPCPTLVARTSAVALSITLTLNSP